MNNLLNHTGEYPISKEIMSISQYWLINEKQAVTNLVEKAQISSVSKAKVRERAYDLVAQVRKNRLKKSGIDAFMIEYDLSSEEGIVLMCLAEALLRVPDKYTIDLLIKDKLTSAAWKEHVGMEKHLFVNAATWSLMLTGKILKDSKNSYRKVFQNFLKKTSEPVIRQAMKQAMKIVGKQYVLGETIEEALKVSQVKVAKGYSYSYDMLGEAAMTMEDAEYYYSQYLHAIKELAKYAVNKEIKKNPGISIKLSALHPRYEVAKHQRVHDELYPKLLKLTELAKEYNVGMNIDAEETERLQISLELVERLANEKSLEGFNGIGIVVQAYQKRAPYVLEYLSNLAKKTNRRFMVRLVKGAYWDAEIKHSQEQGLEGYPVFTRKYHTDVSYQACAKQLFENHQYIYPQFATHNAQTVAVVMELAQGNKDFEFQCLHGMGDPLYDNIVGKDGYEEIPCRIYAPVGGHKHLLAYLVRRLLENGANSSFVNRIVDENLPIEELIEDPVKKAVDHGCDQHPNIPYPKDIVAPRLNSQGYNTNDFAILEKMYSDIEKYTSKNTYKAKPIVSNVKFDKEESENVINPNTNEVIGSVINADAKIAKRALKNAQSAFNDWNDTPATQRAEILERFADLLEKNTNEFIAIAMIEAGKTISNAIDEVREAVDFCRYYAAQAKKEFNGPIDLPALSENLKQIEFSGRGAMVCISPWNFPLAIFLGQITAVLAAGNTVVAKPAEQTPIIAYKAIKLLFKAGLPKDVLQFTPGDGATVGSALVKSPVCKGVIFTGSTEVAGIINQTLANKSSEIVPFIAETGGQNAMIVDSSSLPEQVTADVMRSAFDSAGQRCSALRILCLQEDIADNYIKMIVGAMKELKVGDSKYIDTDVGPVIDKEAADNLNAYIEQKKNQFKLVYQLEPNEKTKNGTFVMPTAFEIEKLSDLGREQFGPILHILRFKANQLSTLVDDINATGYGLTAGVHSRINEVMNYVKNNIKAGNVYVNRNIVGAVVGVQPFGGQGKSGTGPKAGGPFYMHRLANEKLSGVGAVEEIYNPEKVANDEKVTNKLIKDNYTISSIIAGEKIKKGNARNLKSANEKIIGKAFYASVNEVDKAVEIASKEADIWNSINAEQRANTIEKFLELLEKERNLIASCLVVESNVSVEDAQIQIDKTIQQVAYYCLQAKKEFSQPQLLPGPTGEIDELSLKGRGLAVSMCSSCDLLIRFVGQTTAALLAGNTVVARPAYTGNLTAYKIIELMLKAGVSNKVLHLILSDEEEISSALLFSSKVAFVTFSGSVPAVKQVHQALALRRGAIIPFVAESVAKDGKCTSLAIETASPLYLRRFVVEKTVSVDTTASGGNASLMSLEE
ncbi:MULTISPECIES: bifunctional proline dehydrogenase/L-glutamate gamma-semialdehyde dehydrogenase PutA [unclassified Francisella]|uniref:bifunctional proline dehydrogenase/L-glutamate gamma-semialdehyde dehydrogenase PutA n=1 Tax=unclassified Francisella TaxID=2610885 RepID=UPI002E34D830|nr:MULTISPECIES: bifunctional proline dehydrogenase/L-glutamate gamma-semialdehyde dehydrogenase PutA [unclassified Francisella]MED7819095.1 bifunctional proline dehydrogenase/L-glutamate gamma-semialdehyde dehydrogenase PutA [Francisella sp. 19S2-4]MED7829945.1 bifunctional proline dehydrogenase/L-glutamate gamma-semialdehyde dehydrogenase PutA [Francisella sp. 19S2-10]